MNEWLYLAKKQNKNIFLSAFPTFQLECSHLGSDVTPKLCVNVNPPLISRVVHISVSVSVNLLNF